MRGKNQLSGLSFSFFIPLQLRTLKHLYNLFCQDRAHGCIELINYERCIILQRLLMKELSENTCMVPSDSFIRLMSPSPILPLCSSTTDF